MSTRDPTNGSGLSARARLGIVGFVAGVLTVLLFIRLFR